MRIEYRQYVWPVVAWWRVTTEGRDADEMLRRAVQNGKYEWAAAIKEGTDARLEGGFKVVE